MKICVLIKQVPDKDSKITISPDSKSIDTSNITNVINESDNYALEEALLLKEKHGGEVVVCSLGGDSANEIIKTALAKGADKGIHLIDNSSDYKDILTVAKIIAKPIIIPIKKIQIPLFAKPPSNETTSPNAGISEPGNKTPYNMSSAIAPRIITTNSTLAIAGSSSPSVTSGSIDSSSICEHLELPYGQNVHLLSAHKRSA